MDIEIIRNVIVTSLHQYLEIHVVMYEQEQHKPSYPFLAYKITTLYANGFGMDIIEKELKPSLDTNFDYDINEIGINNPTFIISFTVYSLDSLESQELAIKALNYIKHSIYYTLKMINVIVTEVSNITDRTILIVDNYEYRNGFDVTFKTTNKIDRRIETIEEINIV